MPATSHQSSVPSAVADYFGIATLAGYNDGDVTIAQTFVVGVGWKNYHGNKRISLSWVRKAKAKGVTGIQVDYHGRRADFTTDEIIRRYNKDSRTPLLGGSLIGSRVR